MIDSITIKTDYPLNVNGAFFRYKNLLVQKNKYTSISGSIPKFLYGNNTQGANLTDCNNFFLQLENKLGLNLEHCFISRIDYEKTIKTDLPPCNYLQTFCEVPPYKKIVTTGFSGIETVLYSTVNGNIAFCAYDKGKEAKIKNNLLRLEYRLLDKSIVASKLNNKHLLSVQSFLQEKTFATLENLFMDFYKKIPKVSKDLNALEIKEKLTQREFINYLAYLYRVNNLEQYNTLKNAVLDTSQNTKNRVRAWERQKAPTINYLEKNDNIIELDKKIAL